MEHVLSRWSSIAKKTQIEEESTIKVSRHIAADGPDHYHVEIFDSEGNLKADIRRPGKFKIEDNDGNIYSDARGIHGYHESEQPEPTSAQ